MKIALITIHHANSYGGTLQALASQVVLSKYGDVSIVDYKSNELGKTLSLFRWGLSVRSILWVIKDVFRVFPRRRLIGKFKEFISLNYNLTRACNSNSDLLKVADDYDFFVCGSDQIWNPAVTGGLDLNYALMFAGDKKKISFSSSYGSYSFSKEEMGELVNQLRGFYRISVREDSTASYLRACLSREVCHTLDPTLMLNKAEWIKLLGIKELDKPRRKYILVYTLKKNKFVRQAIDKIQSYFSYDVVVIDQDPFLGYHSDQHIRDASPVDYVRLMAGASFVITNSFHGTAFAVNFSIPFVSLVPESGLNRVKSFLESVGLEDRLVSCIDSLDTTLSKDQDFTAVSEKLSLLRVSTDNYLYEACCGERL